jgi:leader peptidase (prepilin peptidase)/N-methyltransferase
MYSSLCNVFGQTFVFWLGFLITLIYGLCIGSFLNVLIYRIPLNQSISKQSSHCFSCGSKIKWYDNIPLISYIILGGKCRNCKSRISIQYPVVEFLNAFLWELLYLKYQWSLVTLILFALVSSLLTLSVIDEKTYEIPVCFNYFILGIGVLYTVIDYQNWISHIVGAVCISLFLFALWWFTNGKGLGFGDVKLMFTCGLVVGWKCIIVGFLVGCIISIIIHPIRMKISKKTNKLAFGPYLSLGVYISLFIGVEFINWYLSLIGII